MSAVCSSGLGGYRLAHGGLPLVAPAPVGGDESTMQAPPGRALGATGEPPQRPDVLSGLSGASQVPLPRWWPGGAMPTNRAARIVVVDDEDNITFLPDATLRHFGYEVHVAKTGRDALALVGQLDPDLVPPDVMLPDLDSSEAVTRLRLPGARVPVLLLHTPHTNTP